jgi:predicted transcriptional regulator
VAKLTDEAYAKISFSMKRKLGAIAQARETSEQDIIREALEHFITDEVKRAHSGKRLLAILRGRESTESASGEDDGGI